MAMSEPTSCAHSWVTEGDASLDGYSLLRCHICGAQEMSAAGSAGGGGGGAGGLAIFITTNTATNFTVYAEGGSGGEAGPFIGRPPIVPVDCKHSFRPTDDPKSAKCFECSAIWPAKAAWRESVHPDVRYVMCRSCKEWTGAMMSVTVWKEFRRLECDACGFCEDRTVKVDGDRVVDQPKRSLIL